MKFNLILLISLLFAIESCLSQVKLEDVIKASHQLNDSNYEFQETLNLLNESYYDLNFENLEQCDTLIELLLQLSNHHETDINKFLVYNYHSFSQEQKSKIKLHLEFNLKPFDDYFDELTSLYKIYRHFDYLNQFNDTTLLNKLEDSFNQNNHISTKEFSYLKHITTLINLNKDNLLYGSLISLLKRLYFKAKTIQDPYKKQRYMLKLYGSFVQSIKYINDPKILRECLFFL